MNQDRYLIEARDRITGIWAVYHDPIDLLGGSFDNTAQSVQGLLNYSPEFDAMRISRIHYLTTLER